MIEVMIVDDDFMVARIHTGFVERTPGFTVTGVAHTGAQALVEAERLQPDLVLLDVYLPDVSGLDLLGALREAAPEVDVLVISAAREADTVRRALRGGIVHYLMKPFSYDDLRAHQFGFIAGMRAALEGVLERFDPAVLESRLTERSMLESLLPSTRKARMWEVFVEHYQQISNEAADDFHTLFGKAFLKAYEEHIDHLQGSAR